MTLQNFLQETHHPMWPWTLVESASKSLDPATADFDVMMTHTNDPSQRCGEATAVCLLGDFYTTLIFAQGEVCCALEDVDGSKSLLEAVADMQGLQFKSDILVHFVERDQRCRFETLHPLARKPEFVLFEEEALCLDS